MRRALILSALLVATLFVGPGAGLVSAQEAGNSSEFTIEELKEDGAHPSNAPDGTRFGDEKMYWLVHWPANNPFADVGNPNTGQKLASGTQVNRNSVNLRTWAFDDSERTVHVVYWQQRHREVPRGNGTVREPYAANVTHVQHDVTFQRGRPNVEIPLRQHDAKYQVTMWIEGQEWARWRFSHRSIATTQEMSIGSVGEYLGTVAIEFLLPIIGLSLLAGWLVKRALERANSGTGYGYGPWIAAITILTGIVGILFFESLAELVVALQIVVPAYVAAVIGVIILETYDFDVRKGLFVQATLEHVESPSREDAYDIVRWDAEEESMVRPANGAPSVIRTGLFAFLARVFGATASLDNLEQVETRTPTSEDCEWDEIYFVDPEADEILEYEKEGWEFSLPPLDREHAGKYAIAGLGVIATAALAQAGAPGTLPVAGLTALGIGVWGATPVEGSASIEPAPIHLRESYGTMLGFAEQIDDAKHFDEVKEQLKSERVRAQREVDDEVAAHDSTLVQEMMDPDGNVPASLTDGEGTDLEVEPREDDPLANGEGDDD